MNKQIFIQSIILNVAVKIYLQCPLTIISVYIPPDQNISVNDLNNLIKNIQTPFIITGDFNGWSPLWGSQDSNARGKVVKDFLLSNNISL